MFQAEQRCCSFHSIRFIPDARLVRSADEDILLDRSSCAIFALLLERCGEEVSKDELLEAGWTGRIVHENSLAKAIGRLRHALGKDKDRLETVFGRGYTLVGEAVWQGVDSAPAAVPTRSTVMAARRIIDRFGSAARSRRGMAVMGGAILLVAALLLSGLWAPKTNAGRSAEAEALVAYVSNDLIAATDPYSLNERDPKLRNVVERIALSMDTRFADHPASLVSLHQMVANAVSGWGEYGRAVRHLDAARDYAERYLPASDPVFVKIDTDLCQQLRLAGQTKRGERVCLRALSGAEARDRASLPRARVNRAKMAFEIGDYAAARATLRQTIAVPADLDPNLLADAYWFLGLSERKLARFPAADEALRAHIAMREEQYGADHPLTGWAYSDYGDLLVDAGRYDDGLKALEKAQTIFDARLGSDHLESQSPKYSVALVHAARGDRHKARDIFESMLAIFREKLGSDHFWTLYTMTELADVEAELGDIDAAAKLVIEAQKNAERLLYGRPGKEGWFRLRWAEILTKIDHKEAAATELRRSQTALRSSFGSAHPWHARSLCAAARLAKPDAATRQARACLETLQRADVPPEYPVLIEAERMVLASS